MPPDLKTNVLYYGDNLEILRKYIPDEFILASGSQKERE